ncbi:PREDICTED: histone-lysine N-methyltransferase ATXR6 isoform X2 [Tarenaya hassleriana]|uniref:histone-lysine N-methyltransferase ATXR6 isoform X2 n=1 Tax=Tarenaya hassleriana TaxID=28532 RepID=UPI00053C9722|nr:PREDICTED: histone-lysine N-methyltransferase ATXR6 isoform X2 [Tarenaya hassleriana]
MVVLRRRGTQAPNPRADPPPYAAADSGDSESNSDSGSDSDTVCEECGSEELPAKLRLCDKCDRGFHLFCLSQILVSVPKGPWFCLPALSTAFPLVQTKIIDFFRIKLSFDSSQISDSGRRGGRAAIVPIRSEKLTQGNQVKVEIKPCTSGRLGHSSFIRGAYNRMRCVKQFGGDEDVEEKASSVQPKQRSSEETRANDDSLPLP